MSSEIYNQNYGRSIYNLRLNSLTFSATKNKLWQKTEPDSFSYAPVEGVPIDTKAKIFSNELIRLVDRKQATPAKINQALSKYLPNTKIQLVSMNDYDEFGMNTKKNVAAATRPIYDKNGILQELKIFVPELEYGDKISENKYIENLTHEVTHAMQFAEDKDIHLNRQKTPEGHFYNFYQQNVANMLIDTMVQRILVTLAKRDKIEMNTLADYDKFIEQPCLEITDEEVKNIFINENSCSFDDYIKTGFDVYMAELMHKMQVENDVIAQKLIEDAGGLDAFKQKVMKMTALTLRNEEEAYKAGANARKTARNFVGRDYNDAIWQVIGLTSDALYS